MLPGLFDGFGGVDYGAITTVMDVMKVPRDERPVIFDKCLIAIRAIREIQEAERGKKG